MKLDRKGLKLAVLAALCGFALFGANAEGNYAFTYQAALKGEHGETLETRNHQVNLRLYTQASGGCAVWGRLLSVYTDANGLFNLEVSDSSGSKIDGVADSTLESIFTANAAGGVYVGLEVVGSAGEIVPRQRLFAVPFAAVANDVRAINHDISVTGNITVGSGSTGVVITPSGIDQKSGTGSFADLEVNGDASIVGAATIAGGLTVNGGKTELKSDVNVASGNKLSIAGSEVVPVPVGGIIMWTKAALPDNEHWAICNGQNGTPDLRERFVVGSKDADHLGDTGGAANVTLTVNQIPPHRHLYTTDDGLEGKNGNDLGNASSSTTLRQWLGGYDADSDNSKGNAKILYTSSQTALSGGDVVTSTASHENRPPFYSLYFIMRIK